MQKSVDAREGALSAVECLTYKLGRWALLQLLTNTYTAVQVSSYQMEDRRDNPTSCVQHTFSGTPDASSCHMFPQHAASSSVH